MVAFSVTWTCSILFMMSQESQAFINYQEMIFPPRLSIRSNGVIKSVKSGNSLMKLRSSEEHMSLLNLVMSSLIGGAAITAFNSIKDVQTSDNTTTEVSQNLEEINSSVNKIQINRIQMNSTSNVKERAKEILRLK